MENSELDSAGKAEAIRNMVGKAFVPTSKYNDEKAKIKTQIEAYNNLKTEFDTYKQSKMTDEEKQAEQARKIQEQYQKANLTISKMYAENTFAKAGFQEEDYKDILDRIVTEDTDQTKGLAETICNTMLKQRKDIEKDITKKILQGKKEPPAGNDNSVGNGNNLDQLKAQLEEAKKKNDYVNMAYYTRLIQEEQNKEI